MQFVPDLAALRAQVGAPGALAAGKVMRRLDEFSRAFIARSPFLVLATTDAAGRVDASPRGDAPGFVHAPDDDTLLLPDRLGNNRIDSYSNIFASPGVGLLFFIPGIDDTLRVNGQARVTDDPALLATMAAEGKAPGKALVIRVEEVFFHCAKALRRSRLWDPHSLQARGDLPSLGAIIAAQTKAVGAPEADAAVEEDYRTRLY